MKLNETYLIFSNIKDEVENHDNLLFITAQVWSVLARRDCMVDHQVFGTRPHPSAEDDDV